MKFNCGLSPKKRSELRNKAWEAEKRRLKDWHDYFAWFPTRLGDNDCRWLETIKRRGSHYMSYCEYSESWKWTWEYRAKR